jgi:hypothetical protein
VALLGHCACSPQSLIPVLDNPPGTETETTVYPRRE